MMRNTMKVPCITALVMLMPMLISAGTLFEDERKINDPFIGEIAGFSSFFVNPAGAAGQSDLDLSIRLGGFGSSNSFDFFSGLTDMVLTASQSGFTPESVADLGLSFSRLRTNGAITNGMLNAIFGGTPLDIANTNWTNPEDVVQKAKTLTPEHIKIIEAKAGGIVDGSNSAFYRSIDRDITNQTLFSLRGGFLIKGFGVGLYDLAQVSLLVGKNSQKLNIQTVYNELGVIAGGAFRMFNKKLALGLTANYGILMRNSAPITMDNFMSLIAGSINYGYSWGLDLGAVWRITPSWGLGIVFNDFLGYTQVNTPYRAPGILGIIAEEAFLIQSYDYEFTRDIDLGVTWQPDWRGAEPRFGFELLNLIGYARDVKNNEESLTDALYRSLEHIRIGAGFKFFDMLSLGLQYHAHYVSAGLGLDLLFMEVYSEFKIKEDAVQFERVADYPIGWNITFRIHL